MNGVNTSGGPEIVLISAVTANRVIGRGNALLWRLPEDMKFFRRTTLGHTVIMGRRTFDSIGKALPKRRNIVLTGQPDYRAEGAEIAHSIEAAIAMCSGEEKVYVIGGAAIYEEFLPLASRMTLTVLEHEMEGDAYFPAWNDSEWKLESELRGTTDIANPYIYKFCEYKRV